MTGANVRRALQLLLHDPTLGGVALWGERHPETDAALRAFARARRGPLLRLPAYAGPQDAGPAARGRHSKTESLPAASGGAAVFQDPPPLLERALGGVLLVEAADLLPRATAVAFLRQLDRIPPPRRPLLVARSPQPPGTWPALARGCGLWVPEPDGRHLSSAPSAGDIVRFREPEGPPPRPLHRELLRLAVDRVPSTAGDVHRLDRFVVRTAAALAALEGAAEATARHVEEAVRFVLTPRGLTEEESSTPPSRPPETTDPAEAAAAGDEARRPRADKSGTAEISGPDRWESLRNTSPGTGDAGPPAAETAEGRPGRPDGLRSRDVGGSASTEAAPTEPTPPVVVVPPAELGPALAAPLVPAAADGRWSGPGRPRRPGAGPPPTGPPTCRIVPYRRGRTLSLPATLQAAAPWQRWRTGGKGPKGPVGLRVAPEDLRARRRRTRPRTLYILAVDGSGSMARGRMQLAKAAALTVLSGAYRERRYVALVEFRGREAKLLCPPGRSSAAIRRLITAMPSGGGTPLPAALALSRDVAESWLRGDPGGRVRLVLFTDGKANVPLTKSPDVSGGSASRRAAARKDATRLGRALRALDVDVFLVDGGGWRPGTELLDLARRLDGAVVRTDSRRP